MQQANDRLMCIVPISIGLILSLLYTAFNSIKDALLVMVNVVEAIDGRHPGALADRHAVLDLGGGRVRLGLRRRRAGRRAPDLVLQPDAGGGPAGARSR